jgi:signal transduction histidine kinase
MFCEGIAVRPILSTLVAVALLTPTARTQQRIKQVDDPALLPYQPQIHRVLSRQTEDGFYAPLNIAPVAEQGAFEVAKHWRDDSLSFILIMNDILAQQAITQVNRRVWDFFANKGWDVDGDDVDEIPFAYFKNDTAYLEIADLGEEVYFKRPIDVGADRNGNGRWDGYVNFYDCVDLNGDNYKEILLNIFTAYDLTPRAIYCIDWKNDTLMWQLDLSGHVSGFRVIPASELSEPYFLFGVASQGNAVKTGRFDDQHSYVVLVNSNGEIEWTKTTSNVFGWPWTGPLQRANDPEPQILTITRFGAADQTAPGVGTRLILYDLGGKEITRRDLPKEQVMKTFGVWDLDGDGSQEIVVATAGKDVVVLTDSLTILARYTSPTPLSVYRCKDFFGNGEKQILAGTGDSKTIFLDKNLSIKCQLNLEMRDYYSFVRNTSLSSTAPTLFLQDAKSSNVYVVSISKQSIWSRAAAFMTKNQRTIAITMSLLILALAFTNYHRRKIRKNYDVIARQKKELEESQARLEKALKYLEDTQARLVQSEKVASLGRLVAGIAHELNNPVGAIRSVQETAGRALTKAREALGSMSGTSSHCEDIEKKLAVVEQANRTIGEGSLRIERIVQRLRSFARLDQAELQRINIHDSLDETISLLSHECCDRILITREYGDIPLVTCHAVHINQAILNIMTNAVEAISEKGEITVTTLTRDRKLYIRIRDTGVGIPAEDISRVFDPGFTTKGVGVGTGLGLAICYQVVADHHGEIRVESSPGRGSTFTIVLPVDAT